MQIHPADLRLNEGDTSAIAELAQVDFNAVLLLNACDQRRHHAGIQRRTPAIDEEDASIRSMLGSHGPAFEQERVAVAAASQDQGSVSRHVVGR